MKHWRKIFQDESTRLEEKFGKSSSSKSEPNLFVGNCGVCELDAVENNSKESAENEPKKKIDAVDRNH